MVKTVYEGRIGVSVAIDTQYAVSKEGMTALLDTPPRDSVIVE